MHVQPLHQTYAGYMRNHPYGTALYRPLPYRDFHPGSVGYFDTSGEWNPITDLSSTPAQPYTPLSETLQRAPADTHIEWGPKASKNIHSRKAGLKAGVDPALATILPTNVSAHLTFSNSTAGGALLLTSPPITRERYYHQTPFKRWVHDNAAELVRQREEVLSYGLWVVVSTYATADAAIYMWDEVGRDVDVGFDVSVDGMGELGPVGGWKVERGDVGWERYTSSTDEQGRVVFFGGLYFRPRRVPIGEYLKPEPRTVRSPRYKEEISYTAPALMTSEVVIPAEGQEMVVDVDVESPRDGLHEMRVSMQCEEVMDRVD